MTRVDLVDAISPHRLGRDKSQWDPNALPRSQAEEIVTVVFEAIVEALLKGETVDLPFGTFEARKRPRPTLSGWRLKIKFKPGEWIMLKKPVARRGQTEPPPPVPRKKKIRRFKRYPREQQRKQMLRVAKGWIAGYGYLRDEVIYGLLPDAKRWLDLNRDAFRRGDFPEYPLRPAALLAKTQPANLRDDYGPGDMPEIHTVCADWFKSWLAHCSPRDESLPEEVVDTLVAWAKATLPLPTGMRLWGSERVHIFHQLPTWRPPR